MASLFFKHGTMNSSKSAQLMMNQYNYEAQGRRTLVLKPSIDTRDGGVVRSRALNTTLRAEIIPTNYTETIYKNIVSKQPDVIFVDEVQFLDKDYIDMFAYIVDKHNIPVLCYGLMTDFKAHIFPASQRLIELGAKLEEIKTVCVRCSKKANMNMRIQHNQPIFTGESVQIGGNEAYQTVCRACYMDLKDKWE